MSFRKFCEHSDSALLDELCPLLVITLHRETYPFLGTAVQSLVLCYNRRTTKHGAYTIAKNTPGHLYFPHFMTVSSTAFFSPSWPGLCYCRASCATVEQGADAPDRSSLPLYCFGVLRDLQALPHLCQYCSHPCHLPTRLKEKKTTRWLVTSINKYFVYINYSSFMMVNSISTFDELKSSTLKYFLTLRILWNVYSSLSIMN